MVPVSIANLHPMIAMYVSTHPAITLRGKATIAVFDKFAEKWFIGTEYCVMDICEYIL